MHHSHHIASDNEIPTLVNNTLQLASEDRTRVLRRRLSEQNREATDSEPAYGDDFRIEHGHHWMKVSEPMFDASKS